MDTMDTLVSIGDTEKILVKCGLKSQTNNNQQKSFKVKGIYEKNIAECCAKGKSETSKKGLFRATGTKKNNEPMMRKRGRER